MYMYYFGGITVLLLEIYCAVHAVRSGRTQWLFFIFIFPLGGCIAYFIIYVLPDFRVDGSAVKSTGDMIAKKINPTRDVARLKKQLEFSDTIANRQALADEYMNLGVYEDAVTLYESCLEGPYENDPHMKADLAKALYFSGAYEEAKELFLNIKRTHPNFKDKNFLLLLAFTYEQLNDVENALAEYRALVDIWPGEEARCRYALLLKKNGNLDLATEMFKEILLGAGRSPRYYRKSQRKWIDIAKQNLVENQQS